MLRKIDAMRAEYGIDVMGRPCRGCRNFVTKRYNRCYSKCIAYGDTSAESTDWSGRYMGCGLWGKAFEDMGRKPLVDALRSRPRPKNDGTCEGQLGLEDVT